MNLEGVRSTSKLSIPGLGEPESMRLMLEGSFVSVLFCKLRF